MQWVFFVFLFLPFVVGFILVKALWQRAESGYRPVKIWSVIMVLALLCNPVSQAFLLEGFDNSRGAALARKSFASGIIGMDQEQVRSLLGEPSRIRDYNGTPTWEYKQTPGYCFGSYFQVFFEAGLVYSVEANDD